jgi:amino acid transporter
LASAYPHPEGDYHYLERAFGDAPAFFFAWSRVAVIQTGLVAMHAFLIGDYASEVVRLGPYSSSLYAMGAIVLLTFFNIMGITRGKWTRIILAPAIGLGVISAIGFGLAASPGGPRAAAAVDAGGASGMGLAMIFVLLAYGGWNEIAYFSSEVRKARKNMTRMLLCGVGIITAIYLALNYSLLRYLGLAAAASSRAVASDLMRGILGEAGVASMSLLVVFVALGSMNAVIIRGSRTNYAFGRAIPLFAFLGRSDKAGNARGLLFQGTAALILVLIGTGARCGFSMMVEYTAPVFWLFFLLVGISLFVLRTKEEAIARPFRVPLYPATPLIFCSACLYMLYSSIVYTGWGGLIGVVVLLGGIPFFLIRRSSPAQDGS